MRCFLWIGSEHWRSCTQLLCNCEFPRWCWFSTWWPSVPGCWSSFTVLPPAVFWPRPSCQVRFPPVRRLSWCLKSSGSALYSTAGRQKLKLEAAGHTKVGTHWEFDCCVQYQHILQQHILQHISWPVLEVGESFTIHCLCWKAMFLLTITCVPLMCKTIWGPCHFRMISLLGVFKE